jgi:hypothetical protein
VTIGLGQLDGGAASAGIAVATTAASSNAGASVAAHFLANSRTGHLLASISRQFVQL